jgi:hypothetical protein
MTLSVTQTGGDIEPLVGIVDTLSYRPDAFAFTVKMMDRGQGCTGTTLVIRHTCQDAYQPATPRSVLHLFPVPAASFDDRSWRRWLFDRIGDVELHERMEHFVVDGQRPYAPNHGPGRDPYVLHEVGTELDVRTSFRGDVKP